MPRVFEVMRIAIFLPNWIGDVVMATPAIRALRKLVGPDGRLVGLMRPYVADVLAGTELARFANIYTEAEEPVSSCRARRLSTAAGRAVGWRCVADEFAYARRGSPGGAGHASGLVMAGKDGRGC